MSMTKRQQELLNRALHSNQVKLNRAIKMSRPCRWLISFLIHQESILKQLGAKAP